MLKENAHLLLRDTCSIGGICILGILQERLAPDFLGEVLEVVGNGLLQRAECDGPVLVLRQAQRKRVDELALTAVGDAWTSTRRCITRFRLKASSFTATLWPGIHPHAMTFEHGGRTNEPVNGPVGYGGSLSLGHCL